MTDRKRRIVVIASEENDYVRQVVHGLCEAGHIPAFIYLGSRTENILFKLASLRRIRKQLGLVESFRRLQRSRGGEQFRAEFPALETLADRHRFDIRRYDRINQGSIIVDLLTTEHCVTVLAGCGIVDKALIAASRGGCVNGHPAWLPGLRGVDVFEWSIIKEKPFGVTAHLVEARVDAGPIIRREEQAPCRGESFARFHHRLEQRQAEVLVHATIDVLEDKGKRISNDVGLSELCFVMPGKQRAEAIKRFQSRDNVS